MLYVVISNFVINQTHHLTSFHPIQYCNFFYFKSMLYLIVDLIKLGLFEIRPIYLESLRSF